MDSKEDKHTNQSVLVSFSEGEVIWLINLLWSGEVIVIFESRLVQYTKSVSRYCDCSLPILVWMLSPYRMREW